MSSESPEPLAGRPGAPAQRIAQKFETLAGSLRLLERQTGDVATRSRQTRDQAGADRVPRRRENDGDDRRRLLGSHDSGSRRCDNDINLAPDELGRDLGEALVASFPPAILDRDSATLDPAEFAQAPHTSGNPLAVECRRACDKKSDRRQRACLLRACRERPCRRAAEQCDELAPPHGGLPPRITN